MSGLGFVLLGSLTLSGGGDRSAPRRAVIPSVCAPMSVVVDSIEYDVTLAGRRGGLGPLIASTLAGPRMGLALNGDHREIHSVDWVRLGGGAAVAVTLPLYATSLWPLNIASLGLYVTASGVQGYEGYQQFGAKGALTGFFVGGIESRSLGTTRVRRIEALHAFGCLGGFVVGMQESRKGTDLSAYYEKYALRR